MKIRLGFVSNSSSSSFVVVGSKLSHGDVFSKAKGLIEAGRLYAEGSWCCEGVDFFKVTQEMWDVYEKGVRGFFEFYDAQFIGEEYGKIKKAQIDGEEFEVHVFDIDNHHTKSIEDFQDRYSDGDEL
jgi:hypothetical protein